MHDPKRVLQVVATLGYGGVAQMLWRHYRALDRRQIQFDFVSHGPPEDFHDEIRAFGGNIFYLQAPGQIGLRRYIQAMRKTIRGGGPYTAVHAHTNYQSGIVGYAAWREQVPLRICHIRGVHVDLRNRCLLPVYRGLIRAFCNVRLACNRQAGMLYFGARPFRIIRNAVDLMQFERPGVDAGEIRRQLNVLNYSVVLGHVGRFSAEKNHHFVLEILKKLRERGVHAGLVLVGDGPLQPTIEAAAQEAYLLEHVRFAGVRKDIPDLMRSFDVLLLPSYSEGLPNVVIEAQAAGVPALLSDSITREVDVGLGLVRYAPIQDVADWVRRIPLLAKIQRPSRESIRSAMGQAGFDLKTSVQVLIDLYTAEAIG